MESMNESESRYTCTDQDCMSYKHKVTATHNHIYYCIQTGCIRFNFRVEKDHEHTRICNLGGCSAYGQEVPYINHVHTIEEKVDKDVALLSASKKSYRVPIKYRFDLIPPIVLQQLAEVYEEGAQNYGDAKYIEKPLPFSVIINHLMNHLLMFCSGDRSELHLAKVIWGCASMITLEALSDEGCLTANNDLSAYGSGVQEALTKALEEKNNVHN